MRHSLAVMLTAALLAAPSLADEDCLPHGESVDLDACRPPLNGPGMPVTGEWVGFSGTAYDSDFMNDDRLGTFTMDGETGCGTVTITNNNGNLYGPNGEFANGWADGACIEVYVTFILRYQVTIKNCSRTSNGIGVQVGPMSVGISEGQEVCVEVTRWVHRPVTVVVGEICAC